MLKSPPAFLGRQQGCREAGSALHLTPTTQELRDQADSGSSYRSPICPELLGPAPLHCSGQGVLPPRDRKAVMSVGGAPLHLPREQDGSVAIEFLQDC